jgi:hypothetical protein
MHGYNVHLTDTPWTGHYQIGHTGVWDHAVGFNRDMYVPGQIQCLSFQQKKRLAIGTGGAILLDNPDLYRVLRRLRHDGRDSSKTVMEEAAFCPESISLGFHMYMPPDSAAKGILLLNQLTTEYTPGSCWDYPDLSLLPCFKDFT